MPRAKTATIGLKVRTKEPLRARLAAAAKKRGVSLNAEIVQRLEGSFRKEERDALIEAKAVGGVYASFGGLETFTIMRLLANAINAIEMHTGKPWRNDVGTFRSVQETCQNILQNFRPKPGKEVITGGLYALGIEASEGPHIGAEVAKKVVGEWLERTRLLDALRKPVERRPPKSSKKKAG